MPGYRLKRVPLAPADTAWWRMEHPTNLMMITGVFMFPGPVLLRELRSVLQSRLLRYPRFRQRVVQPRFRLQPPYWEEDPHFDINAHLHHVALPAPGDRETLQELVNDLMSTPLDYTKPLWQVHLVEGYGEGSALVCRLHHSIADGIALVRVLYTLTDTSREGRSDGQHEVVESVDWQTSLNPSDLNDVLSKTARYARTIVLEGIRAATDPEQLVQVIRRGAEGSIALAHLLLLSPDSSTPLKGSLGVRKRCAWTDNIPLAEIKAIRRVTGSTVNDVLVAAISGALGRYLRQRGFATEGLNFRAVVPVNLRADEDALRLGNAFGLVFLSLPVGVVDPLDRLWELKRRMDEIKGTPEAVVAFGILTTIGLAPPEVHDAVVNMFEKKATTVITNVPGPAQQLFLAGQPISSMTFWVPQSGRLGLGISLLSYAGRVMVAVAVDEGLIPDPESIIEAFGAELNDLMELVHQAHDGDGLSPHGEAESRNGRCKAQTRTGRRCRIKAAVGSDYCRIHAPQG
jgi:diacylglycerol O-acyltransferase / wax synthase